MASLDFHKQYCKICDKIEQEVPQFMKDLGFYKGDFSQFDGNGKSYIALFFSALRSEDLDGLKKFREHIKKGTKVILFALDAKLWPIVSAYNKVKTTPRRFIGNIPPEVILRISHICGNNYLLGVSRGFFKLIYKQYIEEKYPGLELDQLMSKEAAQKIAAPYHFKVVAFDSSQTIIDAFKFDSDQDFSNINIPNDSESHESSSISSDSGENGEP